MWVGELIHLTYQSLVGWAELQNF